MISYAVFCLKKNNDVGADGVRCKTFKRLAARRHTYIEREQHPPLLLQQSPRLKDRLTVRGFRQARGLQLIDSWSIEIDGRTNEKRYSRLRIRSDGFRRLGGDRVGPQLP